MTVFDSYLQWRYGLPFWDTACQGTEDTGDKSMGMGGLRLATSCDPIHEQTREEGGMARNLHARRLEGKHTRGGYTPLKIAT